ncbi:MAG: hypothetical protein H7326_10160 [Bdellovibrionaceae bacterium]|nr:hypothetical protein [Pseudobdellovibrionaceae bacterium]
MPSSFDFNSQLICGFRIPVAKPRTSSRLPPLKFIVSTFALGWFQSPIFVKLSLLPHLCITSALCGIPSVPTLLDIE